MATNEPTGLWIPPRPGSAAKLGAQRSTHIVSFTIAVLCVTMWLWPSAAQAVRTHTYVSSFSTASLLNPYGIAVDNSTSVSSGDVYVAIPPSAPPKVIKFDSEGHELSKIDNSNLSSCTNAVNFDNPFGVVVNPTNGVVYVSDLSTGTITAFDPTGSCLFQTTAGGQSAGGLAIDPNRGADGTLYAAASANHTIESFDAETGAPIASFGSGPGYVLGIAVDSSGDIFADSEHEKVVEYAPGGDCLDECAPIDVNSPMAIAVSPVNNDLLVAENEGSENAQIADFSPGGTYPAIIFGAGHVGSLAFGIAVSSTTGRIYVPDFHENSVAIFDPGAILPGVTTGPVTEPGQTSATLTGHIDPEEGGSVTSCQFEYGIDTSYGSGSRPCQPGTPLSSPTSVKASLSGLAIDTTYHYRLVVSNANGSNAGRDLTYTPHAVIDLATNAATNVTRTTAQLRGSFVGNGEDTHYFFEWGTDAGYGHTTSVPPGTDAGTGTGPMTIAADVGELVPQTEYHFRIVAANAIGSTFGEDRTFESEPAVSELESNAPKNVSFSSAQLRGSFVGNGEDTHYFFEWGTDAGYGHTTSVPPGTDAGASLEPTPLSFDLSGLEPVTAYHYRLVASNAAGTTYGKDETFTTLPAAPLVSEFVSDVHSDRALLHAEINPGGGETSYHFEYGPEELYKASGGYETSAPNPMGSAGSGTSVSLVSTQVGDLRPGTTYHWRVVAENVSGTVDGPDHTFTTYSFSSELSDICPNAHVRQQTGAAQLLDCRAYELVSAANAGGYDVESSLFSGQVPFGGFPEAEGPSRVLYGIHSGALSIGSPTNRGVDPYVATRGEDGWKTEYVGIPSSDPYASGPFASTVAVASSRLETFAFGGPEICSPCFADGSTGTPIHLPNGELVQGMAGSIPQPGAKPAGYIGKHFSADGSHFVFGSTSQFEPDGNNNGDVSIYDRNLKAGLSQVVSKTPGGQTMSGPGIGELDISKDGSRILIGQLLEEEGNAKYWHLYMNVGDSSKTIDLTPGTTSGALYDGMTEDGSKVFFTSTDQLLPADTDHSADLYEAEVNGEGQLNLTLVSTGIEGAGNTDSCDPSANTKHVHWNTTGTEANCGVVAIGGGGGVAKGDGTVFFLSPELLDGSGHGVQNAPNLYVVRPGSPPHFVATLESSSNAPLPNTQHRMIRSFGSFAKPTGVAIDDASGDVYVLDDSATTGGFVQKFTSTGQLVTGYANHGTLDGSNSPSGAFQESGEIGLPTEIAVDNDPSSPSFGDLYVPDFLQGTVDKFDPAGNYLSQTNVGYPAAVAVGAATGHVYISSYFGGTSVFDANGNPVAPTFFSTPGFTPISTAVDSGGTFYLADASSTDRYEPSGVDVGPLDGNPSHGVAVDPSDDHVFVDEGNRVVEYDAGGIEVGTPTGIESLSGSIGLAADVGNLFVSNSGNGKLFSYGPGAIPPDPNTDNPAVVDGVSEPSDRDTADFQITPSGEAAVFTSTLPLTEYDNAGHSEIFRSVSGSDQLVCISCNPSSEQATSNADLPGNGLGLSDDGRVFFNSNEGLVDRDLNSKGDAYEWEQMGAGSCQAAAGCLELISTGAGSFSSQLLGASSDGTDVYFFTREKLVAQDENGNSVKIYDARSMGGFPVAPPPVPCMASDECHGAASPTPQSPDIKSIAGAPERFRANRCKAHLVLRQRKCLKLGRKRNQHVRRGRHGHRRGFK